MATATQTTNDTSTQDNTQVGELFGRMYSFMTSLKLYHWHVTGRGSYAQHIALDQAIESLTDVIDRVVETTYALNGDIDITVPEATVPENIIGQCEQFYQYVEESREMFDESFTDSIIDDFQEAVQQLLFRLRRLE